MKVTKAMLIKAAKEFNTLYGLEGDELIDVEGVQDYLTEKVKEAIEEIEEGDKFSKPTQMVIDFLKDEEAEAEEVVEEAEEVVEETEEVVEEAEEKPAKEEEKKSDPKPKAEKKVAAKKTESVTYLVRKMVCEKPERTIESIMEELKKKGMTATIVSAKLRRNEILAAIAILKELGKLK